MIPVPEEKYQPLMAMEWAEAQRNTRKRRCRIPAADGTTRVCRDRSCYGCPMASEDHITSETVSLDAIMENSNKEAAIGDAFTISMSSGEICIASSIYNSSFLIIPNRI